MTTHIQTDHELEMLLSYLDKTHIRLQQFGCCAALSQDRLTIFSCPLNVDGSAERDESDPDHLHWSEVTAPEPGFLEEINAAFGTSFDPRAFAGR